MEKRRPLMAEKILNLPLEDLGIIRLVCQQNDCGGIAEMPVSRLEALTGGILCPSCSRPFDVKQVGSIGGLKAVGISLSNLLNNANFKVEFVIRDLT